MAPADPRSAYLAAYRRATAGSEPVRARNLAALEARLAGGESVSDVDDDRIDDDESVVQAQQPSFRRAAGWLAFAKPVALSVGLAGAGLGAIKVGAMTWTQVRTPTVSGATVTEEAPRDAEPESARRPRASSRTATATEPPATVETPEDGAPDPTVVKVSTIAASVTSAPTVVPSANESARPKSVVQSAPSAATQAAVTDRLRREIALMRRAQAALEREQWSALLAIVDEHARDYADGAMQLERGAWAAIARCELARPDAIASAQSFVSKHGFSSLAPRVRRACKIDAQ